MHEHSETAWEIASRYSGVLASETRDLSALIDVALSLKDAEIRRVTKDRDEWREKAFAAMPSAD